MYCPACDCNRSFVEHLQHCEGEVDRAHHEGRAAQSKTHNYGFVVEFAMVILSFRRRFKLREMLIGSIEPLIYRSR